MARPKAPTKLRAAARPPAAVRPRANGRQARVARTTKETDITVELRVDGQGRADVDTGIPFLNHMLDIFARHGFFDLTVRARGDLDVDQHHTVEDVGLTLGQALRDALGTKIGIRRFGDAACPLDEALVQAVVDLSGRPFLAYNLKIKQARVGTFDTELVHDFFLAFSNQVGMNIHLNQIQGRNPHHIIEASFKAFARALGKAKRSIRASRGRRRRRAVARRLVAGGVVGFVMAFRFEAWGVQLATCGICLSAEAKVSRRSVWSDFESATRLHRLP
jgi:imidazoleglycerol-phosphate dehydratase